MILLANVLGARRLRARCRPRRRGCSPTAASSTRSPTRRRSTTAAASIQLAVEPVRGDAEPARGRRADRRHRRWLRSSKSRWAKVLWLLWPAWVWFAVMATGNHFWLDIARRGVVARGRRAASSLAGCGRAAAARRRAAAPAPNRSLTLVSVRARRAALAGDLAAEATAPGRYAAVAAALRCRSGSARTRVTPNALTAAGVALCIAGSVDRLLRVPEPVALLWSARSSSCSARSSTSSTARSPAPEAATPFGAFLDSTIDRVGEGFMLGAIALVFMRDGTRVGVALAFAAVAGSFLVSYTRAQGGGARPEGRRRARQPRRARGGHHHRARARAARGASCRGRSSSWPRPPGSPCCSGSFSSRAATSSRSAS